MGYGYSFSGMFSGLAKIILGLYWQAKSNNYKQPSELPRTAFLALI